MISRSLYVIILFLFSVVIGSCLLATPVATGKSFYTQRPDDPAAIYLTSEDFGVAADGVADDSDALQAAINAANERARFGIVFIPEGRYRLGKTVYVWKGIRLIGYGKRRPVFTLGANTAGFGGDESAFMINFVHDRPGPGEPIRRANPGTFYSAISNVDFEIGEGNPAAVAVRSHFAQHCYLAHIDFHIGSGRAGVEKVGNEIDDCRFFGGDYGIITTKPSPSWPFLLIDSAFMGQRAAAISTEEGGMTLVRIRFENVPSAVVVNPDRAEELFITDSRLVDISGPAIVVSDEHNARSQYNLDNVVCENVPVLASFRRSGKTVTGPSNKYLVHDFTHGLQIERLGAAPEVKTTHRFEVLEKSPAMVDSDITALPPMEEWVNVRLLGAKGDGITDDTKALREAIAKHKALYFPTGRYRVSDTIKMRPETVIVGLSPITTQIVLDDETPAFNGEGEPKALLESGAGGPNIVSGMGLDTRGINNRAVACKWLAGEGSLMNDVRFMGGHGTYGADGSNVPVYNKTRSGDGNPRYKWNSQNASLWVTDGGGGTFKNIWTPSPYASAGLLVTDTSTPGRVYAMSSEHHVRHEARFHNVSNWKVYALQMEEEFAEGREALPVEIIGCNNLTFANLYLYRVVWMNSPFPYGIYVKDSRDLDFRGVHVYSPTKFSFDNTLYDANYSFEVRSREIARLKVTGDPPLQSEQTFPKVEKIAGGFEFIDAAVTDSDGNPYFVDSRLKRIYRWSVAMQSVELVRELPFVPAGIAFDESGNLIVVEVTRWYRGKVHSFDPAKADSQLIELELLSGVIPAKPRILPGHLWRDSHDFHSVASAEPESYYESVDGSVVIPHHRDLFRAYSLRKATPGGVFLLADEFGQKCYRFRVDERGNLIQPDLIAEEGELDLASGPDGNTYISAGQVFVHDSQDKQIGVIEIPERPATLVFGGSSGKTLYITARSSLYRVRL